MWIILSGNDQEFPQKPRSRGEKFAVAGLGGTFDHLHAGHEFLLATALKVAEKVVVGLTTDEMLVNKTHDAHLQSYADREANLRRFFEARDAGSRLEVVSLRDPYGPTTTSEVIEVLVISEETYPNGLKINEIRQKRSIFPLVLVVIPLLHDATGNRISSTRVRERLKSLHERESGKNS